MWLRALERNRPARAKAASATGPAETVPLSFELTPCFSKLLRPEAIRHSDICNPEFSGAILQQGDR
jgi:hypothetical protein